MRIQTRPLLFTKRVMAIRPASISRSVTQPHSRARRPKSPKATLDPVQALPFMRPRCCFRNLTFLGINMSTELPVVAFYSPLAGRMASCSPL